LELRVYLRIGENDQCQWHGIKAKNQGVHKAAVMFWSGGHAKQRLRFWGAPEVIGLLRAPTATVNQGTRPSLTSSAIATDSLIPGIPCKCGPSATVPLCLRTDHKFLSSSIHIIVNLLIVLKSH